MSPPWRFLLLRVLPGLLALYGVLAALAFLFQRRLQYFPDTTPPVLPVGASDVGWRAVALAAEDGVRLEAWHVPPRDRATLLCLHGNAGHRGHRFAWMETFRRAGYGVLLLDWRGYGGSGGTPTEAGLRLDARAAAAWLSAQGERDLVYVGESLGCGVAVALAAERAPRALVLQSGTASLVDVAAEHYRVLPVRAFLKDRYEVWAEAARIEAEALCIHGTRDGIVPLSHGRALAGALGGAVEFWAVEGAGHNDVRALLGAAYTTRVLAFLDRVLGEPGAAEGRGEAAREGE